MLGLLFLPPLLYRYIFCFVLFHPLLPTSLNPNLFPSLPFPFLSYSVIHCSHFSILLFLNLISFELTTSSCLFPSAHCPCCFSSPCIFHLFFLFFSLIFFLLIGLQCYFAFVSPLCHYSFSSPSKSHIPTILSLFSCSYKST